jgi:hypothetical protein
MTKSHVHPTVIDTQPGGTVQVVVGTDSGFEATTAVYYQRITVKLIPIQPAG